MSSSDARLWADMVARVERLEATVNRLTKEVEGEDLHGELYGEPPDHAADREIRAELRRGPGRPPGPRAA
jgi:hypothetical protein